MTTLNTFVCMDAPLWMQILMSVRKGAISAVRSVSTLLDHTTATVSVDLSWSMTHTVKVLLYVLLCESARIYIVIVTSCINCRCERM